MSAISVDLDIDDYLYLVDSASLKAEVERRIAKKEWKWNLPVDDNNIEPWSPAGVADDLRLAFYRRDASRFELLLLVLQRNEGKAR